MIYPPQEVSCYELKEFIKKYNPKTLEFNVFQLEDFYSKLLGLPFKPSFKEYLINGYQKLSFDGITIHLI